MPYADPERQRQWERENYHKNKWDVREYIRNRTLNRKPVPKDETKRPYVGYCEVCGKDTTKHHSYHHWNGVADLGMWVCQHCHITAEHIDKGLDEIYIEKKACIEKEYALKQVRRLLGLGLIDISDVPDDWEV